MFKCILCGLLLAVGSLSAQTKILAIAGSTSSKSVNKQLLAEAVSMAKEMDAQVTLIDLKNYPIPFYNADEEAAKGMPQKVKELRKLLIESDAIMIASPEYNASIPGLLKNTIDWMSRSPEGGFSLEAFQGKTFALMSASPGKAGGARGLIHLRTILEALKANPLEKQVTVPSAYSAFDTNNHLKDPQTKQALQQLVQELVKSPQGI